MSSAKGKTTKTTNKGRPRKYESEEDAREHHRENQRRRYRENKERAEKQLALGKSCYELLKEVAEGQITQDELVVKFRDLRVDAFDVWAPSVLSS